MGCAQLGRPIVDSNGAGDAYVSGFLYGHFNGMDRDTCMRLGAVAGAYACGIEGTAEGFLTRAQLLDYAAMGPF